MTGINAIMNTELISVATDASVTDAVARMVEHNCGAVLVRDGGALFGIFSERDLLTRVVAAKRDPDSTKVSEVATREVTTVDADAELEDCFELIKRGGFRHLPIVDNAGLPIGMVSARDFYRALVVRMKAFVDSSAMAAQVAGLASILGDEAWPR
ncbi:MAG: CBS domain-containing protein [Myxococcales bacterium]|nr:CBS domain-containing protein [Myxococcales bacterium]